VYDEDFTFVTEPSPPDGVPTEFLRADTDSTSLVDPVVDCCFVQQDTSPEGLDDASHGVPTAFFRETEDFTSLVDPVVDCCFAPQDELSWFPGTTLIPWNNRLVTRDTLPWILGEHMVHWIARPVARDKLVSHDTQSSLHDGFALPLALIPCYFNPFLSWIAHGDHSACCSPFVELACVHPDALSPWHGVTTAMHSGSKQVYVSCSRSRDGSACGP
jgi:hypothetical protein